MPSPIIKSGKFSAGFDLVCGENVVVDVAEEVVVGDRVVLPDNAYLGGRSIKIGDDFFGYSWGHPSPFEFEEPGLPDRLPEGRWLEVGRGRRDEEEAVLTVGDRCTFHDNRIDLSARVTIGDDVGLSPEVTIYTHGYWMSALEGYPCRVEGVEIGSRTLIGYRSCVLAGAKIGAGTVIGAQSVVKGIVLGGKVWGGNPLRMIKETITPYPSNFKTMLLKQFVAEEWVKTLAWRNRPLHSVEVEYPTIKVHECVLNVEKLTVEGVEDPYIDDLRWFLFKKGIRLYTKRPFKALEKLP